MDSEKVKTFITNFVEVRDNLEMLVLTLCALRGYTQNEAEPVSCDVVTCISYAFFRKFCDYFTIFCFLGYFLQLLLYNSKPMGY